MTVGSTGRPPHDGQPPRPVAESLVTVGGVGSDPPPVSLGKAAVSISWGS